MDSGADALAEYKALVERLEGVWVWSEYDLEHDQEVRATLEKVELSETDREHLAELDSRYLAATVDSPGWRKYVGEPPREEFWWRFPSRVGPYWDDFFARNGLE